MGQFKKTLGIVGMGRMGRCLVSGILQGGLLQKNQIRFTTRHAETREQVEKDLGVQGCANNRELLEACDTVIIAVKPQNMNTVLQEFVPVPEGNKTIISIVASVSTGAMEEKLGDKVPIVRAMPNTPAFVQAGITALCGGKSVGEDQLKEAETLFAVLGRVARVDEKLMNAVTGLSGCGPAYVYVIMEALTDGGVKMGLPRDLSLELSAQTVLGAAKMLLETSRHPAALKDEVTTPAGCTIDGLLALEEGKLRMTLISAVVEASKRAASLSEDKD